MTILKYKALLPLVAGLFFIYSCTKPELSGLYDEFADSKLSLAYDSTTLSTSSLNHDSVLVSNPISGLLGCYTDPVFGYTRSDLAFQVTLPSGGFTIPQGASLDSLVLHLEYKYTGLAPYGKYGDSSAVQNISIYELSDSFKLQNKYFAKKTLAYKPTSIANFSYNIKNHDSTKVDGLKVAPQVRFDLSKTDFAKDFFGRFPKGSLYANDANFKFSDFKGFVLRAAENNGNGAISLFNLINANSKLAMYYTYGSSHFRIDFSIGSNSAVLNLFKHKYQGSEAANANGDEKIYVQGMAGKRAYFKMENLRNKFKRGEVVINKAELVVPVLDDDASGKIYTPPQRLYVLKLDSVSYEQNIFDLTEGARYYDGYYDNTKRQYHFNLARHVQYLIDNPAVKDYGLTISLLSLSASDPSRVVLAGGKHPSRPMKLKIYYTKIQK